MSGSQTGQFTCHPYCMLIMLLLMHLTGFQPYELMFGRKAPMPCEDWLGLNNYIAESFKSKPVWLKQQMDAMLTCQQAGTKFFLKSPLSTIRTALAAKS